MNPCCPSPDYPSRPANRCLADLGPLKARAWRPASPLHRRDRLATISGPLRPDLPWRSATSRARSETPWNIRRALLAGRQGCKPLPPARVVSAQTARNSRNEKSRVIRTPCYKASRQTNIGHSGEKLPLSRLGCSLKLSLLEIYR